MSTTGERIKKARKMAGQTQLQLADELEISESYVALLEKDKRNPSIEVLIRISEVLGVTLDYLVWGNTNDAQAQLYREWCRITGGRSLAQVRAAMHIVEEFFVALDDNTDIQQRFF